MGKRRFETKPIYAPAATTTAVPEDFDRTKRLDFWNDPDRWDDIDDTHKTMIWEVRRRDRIDVGSTKPADQFANCANPYANAVNYGIGWPPAPYYAERLQSDAYLNQGLFGKLFGGIL